jgi:hypothetical protein
MLCSFCAVDFMLSLLVSLKYSLHFFFFFTVYSNDFFFHNQIQVLKDLIEVQTYFKERKHLEQTRVKMEQIQSKFGLTSDDSLSEDEEDDEEKNDDDGEDDDELPSDTLSISDLTESSMY